MAKRILDAEQLRAMLAYRPETGLFTWIKPPRLSRSLPGSDAGRPRSTGYVTINIGGEAHPAHRIAWVWMTGRLPNTHIDHINGVKHDNRWCNLREVTASENAQNTAPRKRTYSGLRGVYPQNEKWIGRICLHGVRQYLGIFDTPEEAHAAYLSARSKLFPMQPVPREYLDLDLPPPLPPFVMGQRETPMIKAGQRWKTRTGKNMRTFVVVETEEFRVRMRSEQSGTLRWASLSKFNDRVNGYTFIARPAHELEFESWIEVLRASANAASPPPHL